MFNNLYRFISHEAENVNENVYEIFDMKLVIYVRTTHDEYSIMSYQTILLISCKHVRDWPFALIVISYILFTHDISSPEYLSVQ